MGMQSCPKIVRGNKDPDWSMNMDTFRKNMQACGFGWGVKVNEETEKEDGEWVKTGEIVFTPDRAGEKYNRNKLFWQNVKKQTDEVLRLNGDAKKKEAIWFFKQNKALAAHAIAINSDLNEIKKL